jgi:hypothetical protein
MGLRGLCKGLLVFILVWGGALFAQDLFQLTTEDLTKIRGRIIPLVERFSGLKFKDIPRIELIQRTDLLRTLKEDLKIYSAGLLERSPPGVKRLAEKGLEIRARAMVACYALGKQVIYLVQQNLKRHIRNWGLGRKESRVFISLVIAHELTHALQDQRFAFREHLLDIRTVEENISFMALIEGHAEWITELVANSMKASNTIKRFATASAIGRTVKSDKDVLNILTQEALHLIYVKGKDFIKYIHKKGGKEVICEAFTKRIPKSSSIIMYPERFFAKEKVGHHRLLSDVQRLYLKGWKGTPADLGEGTLRLSLVSYGLGERKVRDVLKGYARGSLLRVTRDSELIYLSILHFKSDKAAKRYLELNEEGIKLWRKQGIIKGYRQEGWKLEGADEGWSYSCQFILMGERFKTVVSGWRRREIVLEVQCLDVKEPISKTLARQILTRLIELTK